MRNLVEYPVTDQEIVSCLKEIADKVDGEELVGDMRAVLLMTAADIIAGRHLAQVSMDEINAKWPLLLKELENVRGMIKDCLQRTELLDAVAAAAAACIHDDRHVGGSVSFQMVTARRIKLADALKALKE